MHSDSRLQGCQLSSRGFSILNLFKIPFGIRHTHYKEIAYKIQQFKRTDSLAVGMHIFNLLEFKSQDLLLLYSTAKM